MGPKRFVFVSGDIGGARMQIPVARFLSGQSHIVDVYTDGSGKGAEVWAQEKFNFFIVNNLNSIDFIDLDKRFVETNLLFISTCASSTLLEEMMANRYLNLIRIMPVILGSSNFIDYGHKQWRSVTPDYWFVINEWHAQAIRSLRPDLPQDKIRIVGQPAFDAAMDLIPRKEEDRLNRRQQLSIGDKKAILWWSTGMGELIEEDIHMVSNVIKYLNGKNAVFLMNGCHPKLENVKKGYVNEIIGRISDLCRQNAVRFVDTRPANIPLEELCLAADVILSVTCTEDIKSTMMGGPPVVHLLGPVTRAWMEKELSLKPPHYLPDIWSGESLIALSPDHVPHAVKEALMPAVKRLLREKWQPPKEKATERVARELVALAN